MSERPKPPAALGVTYDMWLEMLCDPVMAAFVIFGLRLDAFQRCRLRHYWWSQLCEDDSGVGSGKTIVVFIYHQLRQILIPNHKGAIYYPTFGTGKKEFWNYFGQFVNQASDSYAPIFASQLGNPLKLEPGEEIDGDGTTHGSDCYKAFYRNGNEFFMPATNAVKNMVTSASLSINDLTLEEWESIDAMSDGINEILLDRARRYSWNQYHPIWGNHIVFSGHAETMQHPSVKRHKFHKRRVKAGDPVYNIISYSYKDYSNLPCDKNQTFRQKFRSQLATNVAAGSGSSAEWLGRGLGIWGFSGNGWITEQMIWAAQERGRQCGLVPVLSRAQFLESQRP